MAKFCTVLFYFYNKLFGFVKYNLHSNQCSKNILVLSDCVLRNTGEEESLSNLSKMTVKRSGNVTIMDVSVTSRTAAYRLRPATALRVD